MEITLEINNDDMPALLKVLKKIKGVKIKDADPEKEACLTDLADAYHETELAEKGELKLKKFEDLMNEI